MWCFGVRSKTPPRRTARPSARSVFSDIPAPPVGVLAPVGAALHRKLFREDDVFHDCGPPPAKLRAVAEVEVLGQRPRAPAPGVLDRVAAPRPGRAGEVGELTARRSRRLH